MDLSLRLLADAAQAKGAFQDFGSAALAAGEIIRKFAAESIKAFADGERTQRQLKLAAGQYTDALNEQAEAMKRKFAVDDDAIRHMDVLLLRYGAAPGQIEGATEAILNYAAATGKDATQAMEMLIRGVESGTGSLGKMGVHFKTTGTFAGDLSNAVEALGAKFGGAGEADARSLDGRMRSVGLATDDLKKTFGAMFDEIDRRLGLLDKLAAGINKVNQEVQNKGFKRALIDFAKGGTTEEEKLRSNIMFDEKDPEWQKRLTQARAADAQAQALIAQLTAAGAIPSQPYGPEEALPMVGAGDHAVGKEKKSPKEKDDVWGWGPFGDPEKSFDGWQQDYAAAKQQQELEILEHDRKLAEIADKARIEEADAEAAHDEKMLEEKRALADAEIDMEHEKWRRMEREQEKAFAQQQKALDRQKEQMARAGDAIGAAIVDAFGAQLMRMAEGGEMDPADMFGDIAATVLTIAGFAIGTYLGAPQVGGAIGSMAGGLVKAGIKGSKKKHDGGWIERYHDGGWPVGADEVPAILQTGERVLSRREVGNMGGRSGVDAMARGGGSTVVIYANDALSFQEQFGRDRAGARGFFNALRIGRGDLVPLFSRR
jgi:hypothetical protein